MAPAAQAPITAASSGYNNPQSLSNGFLLAAILLISCSLLVIIMFYICIKVLFWWPPVGPSFRPRLSLSIRRPQVERGMSVSAINSLPTFAFTASPADGSSKAAILECAICLSEFRDGEEGKLLPDCNHSFHVQCIDMWLFSHSNCPLCRTQISSNGTSPGSSTEQQRGEGDVQHRPSLEIHMNMPRSEDSTSIDAADAFSRAVLLPGESMQNTPSLSVKRRFEQDIEQPSSYPCNIHRQDGKILHVTLQIPSTADEGQSSGIASGTSPNRSAQCTLCPHQACTPSPLGRSSSLRASLRRMVSLHASKGKSLVS
ncbi:hypothetical protein KP509_22G062000 [Ceratopteris richardii]|uniref:RING-type E3 ubiquitin transferase n=1 Tax=Ceratopteris richardii TaxID=49495 RepID=A0A8T2S6U1_CERRI|nr:hypothetical protein KP509_22G062000 [Ceratopteris richardii]